MYDPVLGLPLRDVQRKLKEVGVASAEMRMGYEFHVQVVMEDDPLVPMMAAPTSVKVAHMEAIVQAARSSWYGMEVVYERRVPLSYLMEHLEVMRMRMMYGQRLEGWLG